jgi:hypothetical protein
LQQHKRYAQKAMKAAMRFWNMQHYLREYGFGEVGVECLRPHQWRRKRERWRWAYDGVGPEYDRLNYRVIEVR